MNEIDARILEQIDVFMVVEIVSTFFLILIIAESAFDFITKRRPKWRETAANIVISLGNTLLERTIIGAIFIIGLVAVEPFALFNIPVTWWSWVLAVLGADLTYYWMHRIEHERRVLWAVHSVHHSSEEYNLTTSFRLSWVENFYEWIFFVPMVIIGFDPIQVLAGLLLVVVYQTWIHTEKIGKLGWLDMVFNTPSVHRVHHGNNPQYIDKNYGGILILWDHLFGSFQAEEEKVVYGLTTQLKTSNPLAINFHEFGNIFKDVFQAKRLSDALGYVFAKPGWHPPQMHRTQNESQNH